MAKIKGNFKVKLNSPEKIEELLQELYNEADQNIVQLQNEINKLATSVTLSDEILDAKAKYSKAMNDYIINKDKAIGRKLDIAKLMTEIYKFKGNIPKAFEEGEIPDWQEVTDSLIDKSGSEEKIEEYTIK